MDQKILDKASRITMLILDVDGVMTDGSLYYSAEGEAIKMFNVKDGAAIKWLQRAGIEIAVITGRQSPQTQARADELGIKTVIQGAFKKLPVFLEFLKTSGVPAGQVAYMGDDYHDLPLLRRVGLSMAPADAIDEVKKIVDWIASVPGGRGAVREAAELILKARGQWEEISKPYYE
ncbi:MAG TPA: HAD-IIIA family hydrolase [bacterium]|nr:HAD-IIIA family hydrolase [bacterium]